jgi:DNA mismatch endonuclease (patch repair protein)
MTSLQRAVLMKKVHRRDTAPEIAVRRYLHARGLRFRLHVRDLPGTPDIVLPRYRTIVFVHGCFWHGHDCRHGSVQARTNVEFWRRKIEDNRARDLRKTRALADLGWRVETIWECQVESAEILNALILHIRAAF